LCAIALMLHRIAARISDEFTATVATLAFVILLAIGQPGPAANYNFITPYSHEITHGMLLALGALTCLTIYEQRQRWFWIALSGFLLGLTFLTKPEIFLAAAVACFTSALLLANRFRILTGLIGTALIAPIVAIFLFGSASVGGWRWVLNAALLDQN